MANYDYINLDVKRKDPLVTHLKEVCGIQPDETATINDLQDAILAFEENNGYERPMSLLPERLKPQDPIVPAQTEEKAPVYKPVSAHPRRLVKVQNMLSESPQEYFQINEYKILVKFDEEIDLPEPMIEHIKGVKQTTYKQEKDGSISPIVRHSFGVIEV